VTRPGLSVWQRQVVAELNAIEKAFPGDVSVLGKYRVDRAGSMRLRLRLRTADFPRVEGGLPLGGHEEFIVTVGEFDLTPPHTEVDHSRFLHHAHVLQGQRLCLYLDPSREWDPINGFGGYLDRLVDWLGDAARGRFDPQTALYHAVGGVLHATSGAPTVVVRDAPRSRGRAQHGWLVTRTPHRFDLFLVPPPETTYADHVPVVMLDADLPLGAGTNLTGFLQMVDHRDPRPTADHTHSVRNIDHRISDIVLSLLGASAIRKADGTPQRLIVAVPHPTGGPSHLLAASIPAAGSDHLRALVRNARRRSPMVEIDLDDIDNTTPLEWWPVSDEREAVTTRRDSQRPVAAYAGKTVHIWGCGGLGSWIAEYVVRAGARRVVLCDSGSISGGLLVRQNYVETDIGDTKVEALAKRLRAISDTVEVATHHSMIPGEENLAEVDLLIDATISVAISRLLDKLAETQHKRPVLAQFATDSRTGTLGILTVSMPPLQVGPLAIDRQAGKHILNDGAHEAFHCLWKPTTTGDELIPTRGCSVPTFHGSAADLAGVAASLTSILGAHIGAATPVSGTHLISLPHGEAGPLRTFVPVQTTSNKAGLVDGDGAA
jgi:hypothetical protein